MSKDFIRCLDKTFVHKDNVIEVWRTFQNPIPRDTPNMQTIFIKTNDGLEHPVMHVELGGVSKALEMLMDKCGINFIGEKTLKAWVDHKDPGRIMVDPDEEV